MVFIAWTLAVSVGHAEVTRHNRDDHEWHVVEHNLTTSGAPDQPPRVMTTGHLR